MSNNSFFDSILPKKDELRIQIIYTQVDRQENGDPIFTDHSFNVDPAEYYYPASTVKFPIACLALQRLNELNIKGLDRNTTMITETDGDEQTGVTTDSSSANLLPSVAQYIKKILLVSDNNAFNRLYEFLGQEYINDNLHRMDYNDAQIIHRLSIFLSEQQNRHTNPVRFLDANGNTIYSQPSSHSKLPYTIRDVKIGSGYMKGKELIREPFDFSKKNRLTLPDLHTMIRSVIFPASVPKEKRFNLTEEDYSFIRKYMSMYPGESVYPKYDTVEFPATFVKKFMYGNDIKVPDPNIRIFNKTGDAYGFLIDASYVVDYKNKIEFFLSTVIYCNSDGIFNDDTYDYETIGYPFLKHLGKVVYDYELKRKRKVVPDLNKLNY